MCDIQWYLELQDSHREAVFVFPIGLLVFETLDVMDILGLSWNAKEIGEIREMHETNILCGCMVKVYYGTDSGDDDGGIYHNIP